MENYCLFCGNEIPLDRKFCNGNCCSKWHYRKNKIPIEDRKCVICGDKFTPRNGRQYTCGKDECKRKRRNQMHLEYLKSNKEYAYKKNEGIEAPKPKKKNSSPASKRWAKMSWLELVNELLYYGMDYPESQIRAEKNTLPEDFGKKRKEVRG